MTVRFDIWNELGNICFKVGAFDEALIARRLSAQAIELDFRIGWTLYSNLGFAYAHKRKLSRGRPGYEKSIELLDYATKTRRFRGASWVKPTGG